MFVVETLSARISTDRTPFAGGPTATRSDQAWLPSSPTLSATPPPLGLRRLREMFSKFHFVPARVIVDNRVPFLQPVFFEFLPVNPGRAQAVEPIEAGKQTASRI